MANVESPTPISDRHGRPPLITGASGSIGGNYVERFAQYGPVRAMARSDQDLARLNAIPNVTAVKADVTDLESLRRATEGVGLIIHVAANLSLTDWTMNRKVNTQGTENLSKAANENGAPRVHLISSVGVYGNYPDEFALISEDAPRAATNAYGKTKAEQEDIILDPANSYEASVVRPSNIIGPKIDVYTGITTSTLDGIELKDLKMEAISSIARKFNLGKLVLPLSVVSLVTTRAMFSYVEANNLIDLSIRASQQPEGVGQVFNAVDGNITWRTIVNKYAQGVLGKNTYEPDERLTDPILDAADWTMSNFAALTGIKPVKQAQEYLFHGQRYSTKKADRILGHQHRVSLDESVRATKEFVRTNGIVRSRQMYK